MLFETGEYMDWMKIGSAILLGAMLIFMWPRAKHMIENSPKGSSNDWLGFAMVIAAIALFVYLLTLMV